MTTGKLEFEVVEAVFDRPEPVEPEGGWKKACQVEDHRWTLSVEEGRAELVCLDPHPQQFAEEVDPQRGMPVCLDPYWEPEDLFAEVAVQVRHVDDSSPSTPAGPAEYGFYLEIKPEASASEGTQS